MVCAAALIATGVQAQSVKDFLALVTKKWTTPFEPFQLIGNIYYVGTDGIAAYVIKTSQGLILMDTALPESTGMIKDNITKLASSSPTSNTSSTRARISITPAALPRSRRKPAPSSSPASATSRCSKADIIPATRRTPTSPSRR
jgi:hypothetical protein